jgi:sulfane dehydrogenase subunit SoxC
VRPAGTETAPASTHPPRVSRRALVAGAAAMTLPRPAAAGEADLPPHVPPWTRTQGAPIETPPYGDPSPFEAAVVRRARRAVTFRGSASSGAPLQRLFGIVTPSGLHFERHHAGVPAIDPGAHRLLVHGEVERPLVFTVDELMRFPSVSRFHFIECAGNTPFTGGEAGWTAQDSHGLLSCAEWTGVPVSTVLAEAGVKPGAAWALAEGADAAAMTRSVPLAKLLDDALFAYAQNGERLRPEQGYPLRLVLPGYEGNTNVKWLRRLKLGPAPFQTREETSRYTDLLPGGRARQFDFVMRVKSVITTPSGGMALGGPGFHEISGLAWSGRGRVRRVEVSVDGGRSWRDASLQPPVMARCLTRFRLPWTWDGGPAELQSRATDEAGEVQPTRAALLAEVGPNAAYHNNSVQAWRVAPGGGVSYAA